MSNASPERDPEEWRRYARSDWHRMRILLNAGDGPGAGQFLQQVIEKFLKGYLIQRGWKLRKTHELDLLLDAVRVKDSSLTRFVPLCERVSGYYLLERYPFSGGPGPDVQQIETDIAETRDLISALFPDERLA